MKPISQLNKVESTIHHKDTDSEVEGNQPILSKPFYNFISLKESQTENILGTSWICKS